MRLKILFLIAACVVIRFKAYCQQGEPTYTVKIFAGYSLFNAGADKLSPNYFLLGINNGPQSISQDKNGFGAGLHLGISLEKSLSKLLIVGVDADYLAGKKLSSGVTNTYPSYQAGTINFSGQTDESNVQATHAVISLIPHVVFKVLPFKNNYLYTRAGVIIALNTKLDETQQDHLTFDKTSSTSASTDKFQYGLNLGLQAGAGISCLVKGNLRIYAEILANYLQARPKSDYYYRNTQNSDGTNTISISPAYYRTASSGPSSIPVTVTTTNGNTTTETITFYRAPLTQHMNSIGLTAGLQLGIK